MGYFGGDWDYYEYRNAVENALREGRKGVSLCTEHCSYRSNDNITKWATTDGYKVEVMLDTINIKFS